MFEEIIRKIRSLERKGSSDLFLHLSDSAKVPIKIDKKNFYTIEEAAKKSVAFVDGGNSQIFSTGDMSLSLVRVSCIVFKDKKRVFLEKSEFFVLAESVSKGGEIVYSVSFLPLSENNSMESLHFSSFDETLKKGTNRADISSVAEAARRFAELNIAKTCAIRKNSDIIVLDGSLQEAFTHENVFMSSLQDCCIKNDVVLCALSKSSSLYASDGSSISRMLSKISPEGNWFCNLFAEARSEGRDAEIFFAKLNPKSRQVFRFEVLVHQKEHAPDILSHLAFYSKDPVFLGYPYGLIEADRMARVSNHERDSIKSRLSLALGKNFEDSHEVLDRISF